MEGNRYRPMGVPGSGLVAAAVFLWLLVAAAACGQQGTKEEEEERPMPERTIEEVLKEHTDSLMSLPGVVGTGQGLCEGKPCIKVFVAKKTPELLSQIPSSLEGYTVAVQETGEIRALDSS